jgi:hypothetical protein
MKVAVPAAIGCTVTTVDAPDAGFAAATVGSWGAQEMGLGKGFPFRSVANAVMVTVPPAAGTVSLLLEILMSSTPCERFLK